MATSSPRPARMAARASSKTLGKGLAVLGLLAASPRGLRASEVARELSLNLNTTLRLLSTLEENGFANRDRTGFYTMGASIVAVAVQSLDLFRITRLARPVLARLRDLTGETVTLAARFGASILAMDVALSSHILCAQIRPGTVFPVFPSAIGYALTLDLPVDEVIALSRRVRAPRNLITRREVKRARDELRAGYVVRSGVLDERGMCTVAVPIRNSERVMAALAVAGPEARWNERRVGSCVAAVRSAAAGVSRVFEQR